MSAGRIITLDDPAWFEEEADDPVLRAELEDEGPERTASHEAIEAAYRKVDAEEAAKPKARRRW